MIALTVTSGMIGGVSGRGDTVACSLSRWLHKVGLVDGFSGDRPVVMSVLEEGSCDGITRGGAIHCR